MKKIGTKIISWNLRCRALKVTFSGFQIQFLFFAYIFINASTNQAQSLAWAQSFGSTDADQGLAVGFDQCGNVYAVGYFKGVVDFDPSPNSYTLNGGVNGNGYITKHNSIGQLIWAKQIFSSQYLELHSIDVQQNGSFAVSGHYGGTADLDPSAATFTVAGNSPISTCLINFDSLGNFVTGIGLNTIGGVGLTYTYIDPTGDLILAGAFSSNVDFDPSSNAMILNSFGASDVFIARYSAFGVLIWARQLGGTAAEGVSNISKDMSGNIVVCGRYAGTCDFDPGSGNYLLTSAGLSDIFITKLDVNGNFLWAQAIGGTSTEYASGLFCDPFDNVYVSGQFYGTADFDPGSGTYLLNSQGSGDAFLLKLNVNGNFVWVAQFGSNGSDDGLSINVDNAGVYLAGQFSSMMDFDPGPSVYTLSSVGLTDIFLLRLTVAGNFVSVQQFGGPQGDLARKIAIEQNGNIYMTGSFSGTADVDPDVSIYNITSAGNSDAFLCKLAQCPDAPVNNCALSIQNICSGKSASLSALSNGTIEWFSSANSNTSIASGTAFITPTLSAGSYTFFAGAPTCTIAGMRTPVFVTVASFPTLAIAPSTNTVCTGSSITLTVSGASSYSWSNGSQTPVSLITPTPSTAYTVSGTNSLTGCSNVITGTVTAKICVGLDESLNVTHLRIFPNPFDDVLQVESAKEGKFLILDQLGRIVGSGSIHAGKNELLLHDLAPGLYTFFIDDQSQILKSKIVK